MGDRTISQTTHLRADRLARNLTLQERAKDFGVTPQYLSRLERGEVGSEDVVRKIFAVAGITPNQQFGIEAPCDCRKKGRERRGR